jgi:E3 ubiquitin-protein ligase HUWE1
LYNDLIELADVLRSTPEEAVSGAFAAKFSPASSVQAKFLRVLKTIDYMYAPKHSTTQETSEDAEKVQGIYESFQFSALWRQLGDCLSFIEEAQDTEQLATILLPLIESLMVVCKYVGVNASNRSGLSWYQLHLVLHLLRKRQWKTSLSPSRMPTEKFSTSWSATIHPS